MKAEKEGSGQIVVKVHVGSQGQRTTAASTVERGRASKASPSQLLENPLSLQKVAGKVSERWRLSGKSSSTVRPEFPLHVWTESSCLMFLGKSTLSFKTKVFLFLFNSHMFCFPIENTNWLPGSVRQQFNVPILHTHYTNIQTVLYFSITTISHLSIDLKKMHKKKIKPAFFSVGSNQVICLLSGFFCVSFFPF